MLIEPSVGPPIVSVYFSSGQKTLGQYRKKSGAVSSPYHFKVASGGAGIARDNTKHPYIPCPSSSVILFGTRITNTLYCITGTAMFTSQVIFSQRNGRKIRPWKSLKLMPCMAKIILELMMMMMMTMMINSPLPYG